ncbi:MAG: response regulator [Campylobacteraceae bacterium]|jgi:two-component system chemotaxis response regulator CheY|nr:response regulator [Campylobacteraceae bacterium]
MAKKIMVIDDSSMMRLAVRSALEENGYGVLEAVDGVDALEKLEGNKDIALIVCDVNMPNMDGLTFVTHCKQKPEFQYIPILMLTTESSAEMKEKGKALGVRAWMVKPFSKEVLMAAISKLCA